MKTYRKQGAEFTIYESNSAPCFRSPAFFIALFCYADGYTHLSIIAPA